MPGPVSNQQGHLNRQDRRTGKPGGDEHHQHGQGNHSLGRAILQASGPAEDPDEGWPDGKDEEQRPANAAEQSPQSGQAVAVIDQGHAKGEEYPARHVIADASSQNGDADTGAEQVQLAENAAEHGKGSDG